MTMSKRITVVALLALALGLVIQLIGVDLAYSQTMSVTVWAAEEDPGLDPDWSGWDAVPTARVDLIAQGVITPTGGGSIPSVSVQTVHYDDELVVKISWRDATEDLSTAQTDLFSDAVAIQFPSSASSSVPSICMGQADGSVNIWHWRADSQAGAPAVPDMGDGYVDIYPDTSETYYPAAASDNPFSTSAAVQSLLAGGFGTLTAADAQTVAALGAHDGDEWSVVLRRPFTGPGDGHPSFDVGTETDVAFATWNGSEGDRNGIKSVSEFIRFSVRPETAAEGFSTTPVPSTSSTLPSGLVVGLFFGILVILVLAQFGLMGRLIKSLRADD